MAERHQSAVILIITHTNDNESIPLVVDAIAAQDGIAYRCLSSGSGPSVATC